jgi:arylformamidase
VPRRPRGFDWPVHHVLLGHGVLIAEHLTNLRPLAGRRIEAMFLALAIEGSDGGPARVIARALADAP